MTWDILDINLVVPLAGTSNRFIWHKGHGVLSGWKNVSGFASGIFFSPLEAPFCFWDIRQECCLPLLWQWWLKHPWKVHHGHLLKSCQVYSLCSILQQIQCSPEMMMVKSRQGRDCDISFPLPKAPSVVQLRTPASKVFFMASQHLWNPELVQNFSNLHKRKNWKLWALCCDEMSEEKLLMV